MSHSHSSHSHHEQPSGITEPDVVDVSSIVKFGIGLTVVTAVAHIAMLLMFNGMDSRAAAMEPARVYPLAVSQDDRRRQSRGCRAACSRLPAACCLPTSRPSTTPVPRRRSANCERRRT